jgi:hypothetical protein
MPVFSRAISPVFAKLILILLVPDVLELLRTQLWGMKTSALGARPYRQVWTDCVIQLLATFVRLVRRARVTSAVNASGSPLYALCTDAVVNLLHHDSALPRCDDSSS